MDKFIVVLLIFSLVEAIDWAVKEKYYNNNLTLILLFVLVCIVYYTVIMVVFKNYYIAIGSIFVKSIIDLVSIMKYKKNNLKNNTNM